MGEDFIKRWNSVVSPEDDVYHLGDVAMGGSQRADDLCKILDRLNKRNLFLTKGNHDSYVLKSPCRERFEWIKDYHELEYESPVYGKRLFILSHYPPNRWKDCEKENFSIALHGHVHSKLDKINLTTTRMDVGVDSNDYTPVNVERIIELMNGRKYNRLLQEVD